MEDNFFNLQQTEDEHSINEMGRPSVINKRSVAKPPINFFEKVLDLELSLKRKFELNIVQKLVKHYTVK